MVTAAASEGSEVVRLPQRTPFTMIDNPIIRAMDDYVSLGLYLDLMSRPPGWRINLRDLARSHKQGRIVLAAAMTDLIARGLVFRCGSRTVRAGGPPAPMCAPLRSPQQNWTTCVSSSTGIRSRQPRN